jgi:L-ascorbate metabolism protein UlaG (beta-lactamase superfamily)
MQIKFHGHSAFELSDNGKTVLIDPFLSGNPAAPHSHEEVSADTILLTHGHSDHIGDTVAISTRTGAPVVAIVELAGELSEEGLETFNPNLGGTVNFDWGSVKLVPAWHTSTTPKGTVNTPTGLIVEMGGVTIYHLGDTALFSDMKLIGERHSIDVALMPIGGHYTMDTEDAIYATQLIKPKFVIPCHYDTFPLIETNAQRFKVDVEAITQAQVILLEPGETWTFTEGLSTIRQTITKNDNI